MRLAWRSIANDKMRFIVAAFGITFAVFLMIFQASLLLGFLRAASNLIEATDAQIWITAHGVSCFEFAGTIPRRYAEIIQSIPGVESTSRACAANVQYRTAEGKIKNVVLVGADPSAGVRFPVPHFSSAAASTYPKGLAVDESNLKQLGIAVTPLDVEVNNHNAHIIQSVRGFGSFLGNPYLFAAYNDAVKFIDLSPEQSMYLLVHTSQSQSVQSIKEQIQARLPDVDVWTREEFSNIAKRFWVTQTGAGAGILTAAILGFLIGMLVVSQTVYATTMENIEEFATLKAIGASPGFVIRVVATQSVICGIVGFVLGVAISIPLIEWAKTVIAWIYTPAWLLIVVLIPTLVMSGLASVVSIRVALAVEPARVFRA
jgi:putative ABC transport system permease protein